jgi:hypothetical protein
MKKKDGSIVVEVTVVFMILMIMIYIVYCVSLGQVKTESEMVNDDIATSELAAFKDIDKEVLGASTNLNHIVITDYSQTFDTFKSYLVENLNLNNDLTPISQSNFLKNKVQISDFRIYNMYDDHIELITYNNGSFTKSNIDKGAKTPKGNVVDSTTLYVKIEFDINYVLNKVKHVSVEEEANIEK